MTYIHKGHVVEQKPFSLLDAAATAWALLLFFFESIFVLAPLSEQVGEFDARRRAGRYGLSSGGGAWAQSLSSLFRGGGGSNSSSRRLGGGGGGGATRGRGNVHTLPGQTLPGGAGCGGCGCSQ